ncbi:MAG: hypothetical protein GWN84_22780 [Gammaproteobacteria bacterium]|nr:hypothetical protein [Gammaproteobacteria bacterium]NIR85434.1 hypothetical protein [Gammaproteobacteria bacterium]NIR89425.1 hypothetical protein [Gammaproteobacteria bacterium]NIU06570.1 hypothetical protein [Gammaproteobacteria bacterium]NIV53453.1 hypothetical protein [Gammaproteobacteria bacterium]
MRISLALVCDERRRAVGDVVAALRHGGLHFEGYETDEWEPGCTRLILKGEADVPSLKQLSGDVLALEGVTEILDLRVPGGASLRTEEATLQEEPPGEDEDPWVTRVVRAYPKVVSLVQEFEESVRPDEREHATTRLGVEVGWRVVARHPRLLQVESVPAALEDIVVPQLRSLVECNVDGGQHLKVTRTAFTQRAVNVMYLPFVNEPHRCYFLTGLIMGMLKSAPRLPRIRVEETKCRDAGDSVCYFRITPHKRD